jgi:hypothetical protein
LGVSDHIFIALDLHAAALDLLAPALDLLSYGEKTEQPICERPRSSGKTPLLFHRHNPNQFQVTYVPV